MNTQPTPETDAIWEKNKDSHPAKIEGDLLELCEKLESERNAARRMWSIHQDKLAALREQVRLTIMENLHLADGDVCTLKRLKDAIGFDLDSPENA